MKKGIDPKLIVVLAILLIAIAGFFLWNRSSGAGGSVDDSNYAPLPKGHREGLPPNSGGGANGP